MTNITSLAQLNKTKVEDYENFTRLFLYYDSFTTLPDTIGMLYNLIVVNIHDNTNLTHLPDSLCLLSNLTTLFINYNKLIEIPKNIGMLTNLIELDLWGNNLTTLPDSICHLTNLITLKVLSIVNNSGLIIICTYNSG
jgi:Leucine-rich repeat (LRR) protein